MKASEKLFQRYEWLARKYANRIFSYQELSFEYDDLLQEFRLKIYTSIKAYGRRWLFYRREGYNKPVPIRFYIERALANKANDFKRYIIKENYKTRIDDVNYDYGVEDTYRVEPERNVFVVNGVNLLEGLKGREYLVFNLFLRGYPNSVLTKVYRNVYRATQDPDDEYEAETALEFVERRKAELIERHGTELTAVRQVYSSYQIND